MKNVSLFLLLIVCVFSSCSEKTNPNSSSKNATTLNGLTAKEQKDGWVMLFDGKSLNGWRGYNRTDVPAAWTIEDNLLKINSNKSGVKDRGDLIFDKQFKDFELQFEWKVGQGANGGIFFLAEEVKGKPIYRSSPEFQLLDNENHPDARQGKDGNRKSASLYDMIPAQPQNAKPFGEWNSGAIIVKNGKVTHMQNGEKVVEYTLWTPEWHSMIENSKFKGWEEMINVGGDDKQGYIGFQDHGDDIWFRNIKLKVLK